VSYVKTDVDDIPSTSKKFSEAFKNQIGHYNTIREARISDTLFKETKKWKINLDILRRKKIFFNYFQKSIIRNLDYFCILKF